MQYISSFLFPVLKFSAPADEADQVSQLCILFDRLRDLGKCKYITQLLCIYISIRLDFPRGKMLRLFGDRCFAATAPAWNALPLAIGKSRSLQHFKSSLKTYLFKLAFDALNTEKASVSGHLHGNMYLLSEHES